MRHISIRGSRITSTRNSRQIVNREAKGANPNAIEMTKTPVQTSFKEGTIVTINPLLQVPDKNRKTKPRGVLPSSINGVEKK